MLSGGHVGQIRFDIVQIRILLAEPVTARRQTAGDFQNLADASLLNGFADQRINQVMALQQESADIATGHFAADVLEGRQSVIEKAAATRVKSWRRQAIGIPDVPGIKRGKTDR